MLIAFPDPDHNDEKPEDRKSEHQHLSVAIIAQDEGDRIADCLKSVSFADEIILVDSGSKDNTVNIAKSFGCRVFFQAWPGYAKQKQFAVDQCRYDWILLLDADERVPEKTAELIKTIGNASEMDITAYSFYRKNFFHKRWIRCCGWWPDKVTRLVNRRHGQFSDHQVHERWISQGNVRQLDAAIEHHSFRNYSDLIDKVQKYSSLGAREMHEKGQTAGWWTPLTHGMWMFFRTYFLELGIGSGFDGFMISVVTAGVSFMKYAKLREYTMYGK